MTGPGTPARGRPRDPRVDAAILEAAVHLLREHGYGGMSIEQVAADAGVGKAAIYRRYSDKADLAGAALASYRDHGELPRLDDPPAELAELLRRVRRAIETLGTATVGTLLVEERANPELMERFRERAVTPGRAQGRAVLERARARGELREGADAELALDMLVGPFFARHLSGARFPRGWERRVADAVWRTVARDPGQRDGDDLVSRRPS